MSEFIAEATVLVRPDTTKFRALLQTQLAAATRGVTVPVTIVPAAAGVTAAAANVAKNVAQQITGITAAQQGAAAATRDLTAVQNANVRAAQALALAQGGVAGAASAAAAASTTLTRSTAAVTLAEAALVAALEAEDIILINTARNTLVLAQAQVLEAETALAAARAQATHAASLGNVSKGAFSGIAALTGLRGAVLAANPAFLAGAIAIGATLKSLAEFADFEKQLNIFAVTAQATGEELAAAGDIARELGSDLSLPATSASDAASALTELAKAGLSVEDSIAGVRGVLQLSTAAEIGVGEAAQFAANELNAFGLAGDQAVRVADVLANAANSAQGSISDFGLALKQSAAVANQVGFSLEATAAQLSVMARAGLQGSDAGTSLRVALLRLINPTKAAKEVIEDLGINLRDVNGNIRPDVFVQFAEATERMAPALRDANAAIVFGADGIRTLAVSAQAGREGLVDATIAIGEQGTAAELASARTAGFSGQLEGLKNTAEASALSIGEMATVIAGPLVLGLTQVVKFVNLTLEPLADLVRLAKEAAGIGGAFDPTKESAAELLAQLRETQAGFADLNKRGVAVAPVENAIKRTIAAFESERDTLKALGLDTSSLTALITLLQNELRGVAGAAVSGLTPLEEALKRQRANLEAALGKGVDTSLLRKSIAEIEQALFNLTLEGNLNRLRDDFISAAGGADILVDAMKRLTHQSDVLSDQLQKAQAEGASPQAQIALLQQDNAIQQARIAEAEKGGREPGDITAIRDARAAIIANNREIESLQQGLVSDQKAAATASQTAAKDAQAARDKQFEALAELFGGRQGDIENKIERAGIAGNVQKQINLTKALIESLKKERDALIARLRTLRVSNEVRKKILSAIVAAIEEAQQDILRFQKAQRDAIAAFSTPTLDARIRIAQAQDNIAAEIALRRKRVELISKELARLKNANKKGTQAWLDLRVQLAEERAAIRDLQDDQDKGEKSGKSPQQFFFEQLQAQQGFAANLLGNLITGPTAGLVGVQSTPGAKVDKAARTAEAGKGVGPTSGQAQTTNALLERILTQLKHLNGEQDHPEATHQRRVGRGSMDNVAM